MNKLAEKNLGSSIVKKRMQLKALREEIEDLSDYLDVLEARARDLGKPRLSHDELKKRYAMKPAQHRARNGRRVAA